MLTALYFTVGEGEACVGRERHGVWSLTEGAAPSLCRERISELGKSTNRTLTGFPESPVLSHVTLSLHGLPSVFSVRRLLRANKLSQSASLVRTLQRSFLWASTSCCSVIRHLGIEASSVFPTWFQEVQPGFCAHGPHICDGCIIEKWSCIGIKMFHVVIMYYEEKSKQSEYGGEQAERISLKVELLPEA